ncbi:MAG: hotdog fold thioesterase [Candidatus Neomarinimicrobiota bacterium]|nr:hotdog fold thioesterase [Candidatus Neomarinimicrobiota bacterium]
MMDDDEKKINSLPLINQALDNTLASSIGLEITQFSDSSVCGKIPVDYRTKQPFGLLHGGASVVLAETLGSMGGNMHVDSNAEMVVGIEINANHLKSVSSGWVHGVAKPIKIGRKIQVWKIEISNDDNDLICVSRLTLAIVSKK